MKAYILAAFISFLSIFFVARSFDYLESRKSQIFKKISDTDVDALMLTVVKYVILAIVCTLVVGVFLLNYPFRDNGSAYEPNKFGDFFGGTLGPILSFLSFIALLWTIRSQDLFSRQSLITQSQQLALANQQRDEESFYLLVGRLHELADPQLVSFADSMLKIAYNEAVRSRQAHLSQGLDWNPDTFLLKFHDRIVLHCAALRIRFSLLCRIVEHIEASSLTNKKRFILILKSFMAETDIHIFYAMAASAAFEEREIYRKLYNASFITRVSKNPPSYITAIQNLNQDPSSAIYYDAIVINDYLK